MYMYRYIYTSIISVKWCYYICYNIMMTLIETCCEVVHIIHNYNSVGLVTPRHVYSTHFKIIHLISISHSYMVQNITLLHIPVATYSISSAMVHMVDCNKKSFYYQNLPPNQFGQPKAVFPCQFLSLCENINSKQFKVAVTS